MSTGWYPLDAHAPGDGDDRDLLEADDRSRWVRTMARLLPWFSWDEEECPEPVGTRTLYSRAGERTVPHGPPYDEVTVVLSPWDWKVGFDYTSWAASWWSTHKPPPGARNRTVSVQVGPVSLYVGRSWN